MPFISQDGKNTKKYFEYLKCALKINTCKGKLQIDQNPHKWCMPWLILSSLISHCYCSLINTHKIKTKKINNSEILKIDFD